ncbi:acrEF/envCD operon transcriptional regulator [Scandinavium sp. V105_16]|uniref:AcrEF/envCD operon transcriptional regulator n=1 Tax=Scandinavium lactucae TaxID=3095028 RepID=A0AAJ2S1S8_9ENTR|nr:MULTISPECIES: acrEF/envCD operon transcriptional regulator [unclassified Scandinavium]MDX6020652.1 acrEF/envCD operon transcriptional regulator [Scandinavium sp. V105_16]MDX6030872.1 acrEF/envCD operon transcriptional regulator [Scandinavium sp. V105_12]
MVRKTKADALATRQQLIDAAIEQFALRGVSNTTLTDIADAAGVTRGAVYWHFNSKVEIFNEMWRQQLPLSDIIKHRMIQNEKENPLGWLREAFVTGLQYIAQTPKQRALMQILYHKCEFNKDMMCEMEIRQRLCFRHENMQRILSLCIRQGSLPAETNIELTLVMLHGFFSGVLKNWLLSPESVDLYHQAPELVDYIMATLHPHPALWPVTLDTATTFQRQGL